MARESLMENTTKTVVPLLRSGHRRFGSFIRRFLIWSMAFFGLSAVFAVCPFCGRPGCPGGALILGPLGGLIMTLLRGGRSWFRHRRGEAREEPVCDTRPRSESETSEARSTDCKVNQEHHAAT
jgi:hypothetical protein